MYLTSFFGVGGGGCSRWTAASAGRRRGRTSPGEPWSGCWVSDSSNNDNNSNNASDSSHNSKSAKAPTSATTMTDSSNSTDVLLFLFFMNINCFPVSSSSFPPPLLSCLAKLPAPPPPPKQYFVRNYLSIYLGWRREALLPNDGMPHLLHHVRICKEEGKPKASGEVAQKWGNCVSSNWF